MNFAVKMTYLFSALQQRNACLQAEIERLNAHSIKSIRDINAQSYQIYQEGLIRFGQRLSSEFELNLKEARLNVLRDLAPHLSATARKEIDEIAAKIS